MFVCCLLFVVRCLTFVGCRVSIVVCCLLDCWIVGLLDRCLLLVVCGLLVEVVCRCLLAGVRCL